MGEPFDVIPFEDLKGDWVKLGSGSFGKVYKATYLGIPVAVKEVLPSTEYDVSKYFEREWRLMKEARHPNVVLYIGLSRAPPPDSRIFIISEYIDNGNLRGYIHDKTRPFPWRLRLSFATDICRALAYLHARKCIHRDLKGENLLLTANARVKVTDFGFARIAARNDDETKRLTFCGTDSYMSPEILIGNSFDLPTDIFSLGVIFCEMITRQLADDDHFKRTAPDFGIDSDEIRSRASPGCPTDFIELAIDCCKFEPSARPTTREILERLAAIESDVLSRTAEEDQHVGSIKFVSTGRRPGMAPRIPSFGEGVGKDIAHSTRTSSTESTDDEEDTEIVDALMALDSVDLGTGWDGHAALSSSSDAGEPLINGSDYSTTVVRHPAPTPSTRSAMSSILTVRQSLSSPDEPPPINSDSVMTIESYHTASTGESNFSIAAATEGGSTVRAQQQQQPPNTSSTRLVPHTGEVFSPPIPVPFKSPSPLPQAMLHRFTLIKPGAKRPSSGRVQRASTPERESSTGSGWSPFDFFFSSGMLVARCDLCTKRLGWKPVLECDDCGLRTHIKCGDYAPRDCGVRAIHRMQSQASSVNSKVRG